VLPADVAANIEAAYHLDESLPQQFMRYMSGLVRGDLGPSYRYRDYTVAELIGTGFPLSLQIGALAMLLALLLGVSSGTIAALKQGSMLDRVLMSFAMTGISVPVFVVAPVLVLLLAVKLHWLPAGWSGTEGAAKFVLPVIACGLEWHRGRGQVRLAGYYPGTAADCLHRAADAREHDRRSRSRLYSHSPGAGPGDNNDYSRARAAASDVAGAVGQFFVRGALNRDYTLVLGIVIFYATLIISLNLIVDILYGVLDPRVRRQ